MSAGQPGAHLGRNDHLHLVTDLVKEDGRQNFLTRPDFSVLARVRAEMKAKYSLTVTGKMKTRLAPPSRLADLSRSPRSLRLKLGVGAEGRLFTRQSGRSG